MFLIDGSFIPYKPAQIAGCKTVVLATPPTKDGSICKVFVFSKYLQTLLVNVGDVKYSWNFGCWHVLIIFRNLNH